MIGSSLLMETWAAMTAASSSALIFSALICARYICLSLPHSSLGYVFRAPVPVGFGCFGRSDLSSFKKSGPCFQKGRLSKSLDNEQPRLSKSAGFSSPRQKEIELSPQFSRMSWARFSSHGLHFPSPRWTLWR